MKVIFTETAWSEYLQWLALDKKILQKINDLIKDIQRNGLSQGIGKPEPLKGRKEWSRRITQSHRLIYTLNHSQDLVISSCEGHYDD